MQIGVPLQRALKEVEHVFTRTHRQTIPSFGRGHESEVGIHSQNQDVLAAA
jgi:hypothetical protein